MLFVLVWNKSWFINNVSFGCANDPMDSMLISLHYALLFLSVSFISAISLDSMRCAIYILQETVCHSASLFTSLIFSHQLLNQHFFLSVSIISVTQYLVIYMLDKWSPNSEYFKQLVRIFSSQIWILQPNLADCLSSQELRIPVRISVH